MREFHQWRAVRADHEYSVGDAIPEGTARSSTGGQTRSRSLRENRSVAYLTRLHHRRSAQPTGGSEHAEVHSVAAPSVAAVRSILRRDRSIRDTMVCPDTHGPTQWSFDGIVFHLLRDFSHRS